VLEAVNVQKFKTGVAAACIHSTYSAGEHRYCGECSCSSSGSSQALTAHNGTGLQAGCCGVSLHATAAGGAGLLLVEAGRVGVGATQHSAGLADSAGHIPVARLVHCMVRCMSRGSHVQVHVLLLSGSVSMAAWFPQVTYMAMFHCIAMKACHAAYTIRSTWQPS
jgi:hypothetical protein